MPAVIWDLDGTMVDTAELHFQAWVELARGLGKPFTRADFAGTFGWRNPEIIPKLFGNAYTEREIAQIGDEKEELYRQAALNGVDLLPGAMSLLAGLQQAGFQQAIGSSAPRKNIDLLLDMLHVRPYISAIVGMEDTRRGKPDPEVFLLAARRLGAKPSEAVVLEDAPVGVQAAKAGGMKAVGITFVGHHSSEKLLAAGADLVVPSLQQVKVETISNLLCC